MASEFEEALKGHDPQAIEAAKESFQQRLQPIIDGYASEYKDGKSGVTLLDIEKKTLATAVQTALRAGVDQYVIVDMLTTQVDVSEGTASDLGLNSKRRQEVMMTWRFQALKMICGDVLALLKNAMKV